MTSKIAIKWLKQALHDLEMAEKNISIGGYDVSAFLAHQSVEKLLKAILIIKGGRSPKSHYIDELAKELRLSKELIDASSDLSVDYTFSRYPDVTDSIPYEQYNEEIAKEKVNLARKFFESLKDSYKGLLEEEDDR
jgi:HEPN domain-containing protein